MKKILLDMVYICPGGNCTGITIFFFDKVSHLIHPSWHESARQSRNINSDINVAFDCSGEKKEFNMLFALSKENINIFIHGLDEILGLLF